MKRTRLAPLFLLAASAIAAGAPKADDDPIAAQLLKDKEAYVANVEKARGELLKAFDKQSEAIKKDKTFKIETQLSHLEKLEAEKKAFEENGTIPVSLWMKVGLSEYRSALKKAELQCKAAFEAAAKAYRDKSDLKLAGATLEEMKEFLAKAPSAGAAAGAAGSAVVINCAVSNKVLGTRGGGTDDGTLVVTANYAKGDQTQLWKVVSAGNGFVYFENVKSGLVMTANGKNNGVEAHIARKRTPASDNQLWKITPVANVKDAVKVFAKASDKLIGVDAKSKDANARILLWSEQGNEPAQIFGFTTPK